jgi:hypothetical protein
MGGPISVFLRERVPGPGFSETQTMSTAKSLPTGPDGGSRSAFWSKGHGKSGTRSDNVFHVRRRHPECREPSAAFANTPQRRMERLKSGAKIRDSEIKDFGSVVCFRSEVDLGQAKLPTVACFMDEEG